MWLHFYASDIIQPVQKNKGRCGVHVNIVCRKLIVKNLPLSHGLTEPGQGNAVSGGRALPESDEQRMHRASDSPSYLL